MDPALHATVTGWRRHLHAHPELSLQERETASYVCQVLTGLGVPFTAGVGGHGVVATLSRGPSNRSVGLRADMDALPIQERTGAAYTSTRPGVMHACGHDGHTASLLGAAALLARDTGWSGTVQFVFQPAEEGFGGAKSMLADGLLERFPMERIFGFHNWPGIPAGTVVLHHGPVMAAAARLTITLRGHAGHAAMPHLTRDPVLGAGQVIVALQSIVARNVDPLASAVITIGVLQAGTASNQIPEEARLCGTMRSHLPAVRDMLEASIRRVVAGVALACDVEADIEIVHGVTSTINHAAEADMAAEVASGMGAAVLRDLPPSMAGEDFGWLLTERPGAFAWIGNGPLLDGSGLHNASYNFNDSILPISAGYLASIAKRALEGD